MEVEKTTKTFGFRNGGEEVKWSKREGEKMWLKWVIVLSMVKYQTMKERKRKECKGIYSNQTSHLKYIHYTVFSISNAKSDIRIILNLWIIFIAMYFEVAHIPNVAHKAYYCYMVVFESKSDDFITF